MPKQHRKSSSFQVGKNKLLRSVDASGNKNGPAKVKAIPKINRDGKANSNDPRASRRDFDKQLDGLRERHMAKNFKKPPAPKLVLAAPIFDLPTEQERFLQNRPQNPMDMWLFDEGDAKKKPSSQSSKAHTEIIPSPDAANRFSTLEHALGPGFSQQAPRPAISLQPSILQLPQRTTASEEEDDEFDGL